MFDALDGLRLGPVRRNSLPLAAKVAILPFFGEITKIQGLSSRAVRAGRIVAPTHCELCNREHGRCRYQVNGHHESYFKPFDLIFLCGRCHTQRHLRLRERKRDPRVVYAMERLDGRPCPVPFRAPHPDALANIRARVRLMEATAEGVA